MVDKSQGSENTRQSRGAFPRLSLQTILELPQTIFDVGHGYRVRRIDVFDRMGKSPTSGSSRLMVTTTGNSGYGLISGSYKADFLELTDRGKRIANPQNDLEKYEALYEALFSNSIFSSFIERFSGQPIPPDAIAIDYLQNEQGLSQSDANTCWKVFKDNILDFKLAQERSGKQVIFTRDWAIDALKAGLSPDDYETTGDIGDINEGNEHIDPQPITTLPNIPSDTSKPPEFHFNIQIHLPENASAETYENIFKSISIHLLGRKNS